MLKRPINECHFALTLEAKSPLLIKDGNYEKPDNAPASIPNAIFIKGNKVDQTDPKNPKVLKDYYIPGTSLRGIIRSCAEKIVRTIVDDEVNPICCDPFDTDKNSPKVSCSRRMEEDKESLSTPYAYACVICKLFGCTGTASRIQIHDSIILKRGTEGMRDGIGIDRFTGGVSTGANFKNQVLEGYVFQSEITVRNFELWQLGLLAYVFRDFEQELVTLGFGKSKGFGRVKGTIREIRVTYYGNKEDTLLTDIGDTLEKGLPDNQRIYGFVEANLTDTSLLQPKTDPTELTYRHEFKVKDNMQFWKACASIWNNAVKIGADGKRKFKTIPQLKEEANRKKPKEAIKAKDEEAING